jgi:CTP:molybdopterin cytidylyltransferase MocA
VASVVVVVPLTVSVADPTLPGVILAAGAGVRFGMPKALARTPSGEPWLQVAADALREAGVGPIVVVLGADADEASALLPSGAVAVVADDWAEGIGASLAAGLAALEGLGGTVGHGARKGWAPSGSDAAPESAASAQSAAAPESAAAPAAVITLVDLPGLPAAAVRRLVAPSTRTLLGPEVLRQAVYGGRPGHPVVLGREHWAPLRATLRGDTGARPYLLAHGVTEVECGDLWSGDDVDRPGD